MTRLITEWISDMEQTAADWDESLRRRAGLGYKELAARVSGCGMEALSQAADAYKVAVVPVTSGLGTIDTFSESVAAIVRAMGFEAFVTEATDVNGIYEACRRGADILYMADDDRYIALNLRNGKVGDNDIATARGYAEVLFQMAGSLKGEDAAVLGYGIIGPLMAQALMEKGAQVWIYDKDPAKRELAEADGCRWIETPEELSKFRFIGDATSEGAWIHKGMLPPEVRMAAPGIPFSMDEEMQRQLDGQYIHDLLEIGTAVMLGLAI